MKSDILIVDDSKDMLEVISRQLKAKGFNTFQATNVFDAVDLLKLSIPELLITDIQMPGADGGKLVKYVKKNFPNLPILVVTGYPSTDAATEVLKDGEIAYLTKPFTREELTAAVDGVLQNQSSQNETISKERKVSPNPKNIIGKAKSLEPTYHLIDRTKDNKVTVLITGESGTGKELVARAIHYEGKFSQKPFVAVNCGAIPENLLEAELFGYEKGAFTGASVERDGFFMAADEGTIFLDEIGNAPAHVQQSLLRAIQEKEIVRVGGRKPKKIDVRIIAATNSDLLEMVEKGRFREDLYYRLNVVRIAVPPLRERQTDIAALVDHFIQKHAPELGKSEVLISDDALEKIKSYRWPGNVRELENAINQALILSDEVILPQHLPAFLNFKAKTPKGAYSPSLKSLKEAEIDHIKYVLEQCDNNKTKAAKILGITRKTITQKLQ